MNLTMAIQALPVTMAVLRTFQYLENVFVLSLRPASLQVVEPVPKLDLQTISGQHEEPAVAPLGGGGGHPGRRPGGPRGTLARRRRRRGQAERATGDQRDPGMPIRRPRIYC